MWLDTIVDYEENFEILLLCDNEFDVGMKYQWLERIQGATNLRVYIRAKTASVI
jgi:hypothetical protein